MLTRLNTIWERLTTSLWFFPGGIALLGALLAWVALAVHLDITNGSWWIYAGSIDAASTLLSSFLTGLISLTALAISITMVVLTLAAQQLGSRVIRNFVSSWETQFSIGVFVASILYLVLVLRSLPAHGENSVPNLAVTMGTGVVILSTCVLLFFIHHLSRAIVSDTMIEAVGQELDGAISYLLPEERQTEPIELLERYVGKGDRTLAIDKHGYVQSIDYDKLAEEAREANAVLRIDLVPGSLLLPGEQCISLVEGNPTEQLRHGLGDAIQTGRERTATQDLEFPVRQLVEIAMRGMYVWDTYTCTTVLDRLALSLRLIMDRGNRRRVWRDKNDGEKVRLIAEDAGFDGIVGEAFNQIRQSGARFPVVLIHLARTLETLFKSARAAEQKDVLAAQAFMTVRAGRRTIADPEDVKALENAAAEAWAHATQRQRERPKDGRSDLLPGTTVNAAK